MDRLEEARLNREQELFFRAYTELDEDAEPVEYLRTTSPDSIPVPPPPLEPTLEQTDIPVTAPVPEDPSAFWHQATLFYEKLYSDTDDEDLGDFIGMTSLAQRNSGMTSLAQRNSSTLQLGDEGKDVKRLQEDLREVGYKVTKTSEYDEGTEKAVRQFQKDRDLKVTGVYDKMTKEELQDALGKGDKVGQTVTDIFSAIGGFGKGFAGTKDEEDEDEDEDEDRRGSSRGGSVQTQSTNWPLWIGLGLGGLVLIGGVIILVSRD